MQNALPAGAANRFTAGCLLTGSRPASRNATPGSTVRSFLRLWTLLLLSYAAARLLVDYWLRAQVDLRPIVGLEVGVVSLGQALVYRLVTGTPQRSAAS